MVVASLPNFLPLELGVKYIKVKLTLAAGAAVVAMAVPATGASAQYYYPSASSTTLKVKPKRDKKKPFKFTASGKVKRGAVSSAACKGKVTVKIKKGAKTVASGKATVKFNCTYKKTLKVSKKAKKLKVSARFGGNSLLKASSAKSKTVRAG